MTSVLVLGASGYIGANLVPRLVEQGHRVRAAARHTEPLAAREWDGVELSAADALDPASLDAALAGVEVAYYLVHSMAAGRRFGQIDVEAAGNFADAAARAGVKRIVYLGGLVPAGARSEHLVSRAQTGDRLRAGPVPVTEIRAGIIVGPGSAAFEVMRDLVNHLPAMITPRWVRAKAPPIALDNLLEYLVRVIEIPETAGKTYDAAGPETLTYEEMMRRYGEAVGKRPLIVAVPVLSPRLSSYWLRLITAVPTSIARALVAGLSHDIPADPTPLRAVIPQRLLDFREAVDAVFEAERRHAVAARWVEGSLMCRNYNPRYAFYAKRASGSAAGPAGPEQLWRAVAAIGGRNRYYYLNWLWTLREALDWCLGGPGMSRGRRDPDTLRVGDAVDSWRVLAVESGRRLTLGFGMKAPGAGVLELVVDPARNGSRITATIYWHPAGVWGLLYWYALAPAHRLILTGMTRAILKRAMTN